MTLWLFVLACVLPAFVVSYITTWLMRGWAVRWGLIDQPAARKVHETPTPLGGGIGIWTGVLVPIIAVQLMALAVRYNLLPFDLLPASLDIHLEGVLYRSGQLWAILAAGTLLSVMGLIDDLRNLPWKPRLLLQLLVAAALVAGGVKATLFIPIPWCGEILTFFWIIVLINSLNFLDNMDGLSGGIALIAAVLFAIVMLTGTSEPRLLVGGVLLVLAGSLGGFLCHNRPPAKIFMGDTGSYFIGLLLATMTVLGTFYEEGTTNRHVMLAPLCILAVPLYDFCTVLVIRILQGRSPFHADKSHFSHRLVELGLSRSHAVLTVHLTTLTTGLGGLLLYRVNDWDSAWLVIALITCVLAVISILETVGRKKNSRS